MDKVAFSEEEQSFANLKDHKPFMLHITLELKRKYNYLVAVSGSWSAGRTTP